MKFAFLLSGLIGLHASASLPTGVVLKCRNPGENRTLKIVEMPQSYAITMTDYDEKQLIGASYVYKNPSIEATPTHFSVSQINGTKENYSIDLQPLYDSSAPEMPLGVYATISGSASASGIAAKEKVFRTLVPDAPKFNMELLKCTH